MAEASGAASGPRIQWGDVLLTVAISGVVTALLLMPPIRRLWLSDKPKQPSSNKGA